MNKEIKPITQNIDVAEKVTQSPPTTLHLFRYQGGELRTVKGHYNTSSKFKGELYSAQHAMNGLRGEIALRIDRMKETLKEMDEEFMVAQSSKTCSAAYLKLLDELSQQGLTPQDIFGFFQLCLEINTAVAEDFDIKVDKFGYNATIRDTLLIKKRREDIFNTLSEQKLQTPAQWFHGNKKEWVDYVESHVFMGYLNPDFDEKFKQISLKEMGILSGETRKRGHPDWLIEEEDRPPSPNLVEQELAEDTKSAERIKQQREHIVKQSEYLVGVYAQRSLKGCARFEGLRRALISSTQSFTNFIITLDALRDVIAYKATPKEIEMMSPKQLSQVKIAAEKAHEQLIQNFAKERNKVINKETVALWIEEKLRKDGLISTADDIIDEKLAEKLGFIFPTVKENKDDLGELENLKTTDKKAYSALRYDLCPLLFVVTEDELSYFQELTEIYRNNKIEPFIWDLAEVITSAINRQQNEKSNPKQTQITITHLQDFASSWIRKHWQWAYQQIKQRVNKSPTLELNLPREANESLISLQNSEKETAKEIEEIEVAIEEVKQGNLKDWRIYYTPDRKTDSSSLIEINGSSMQEREEIFNRFIKTNSISCSIKPESVIRALEWVVGVPREVEQIRMSKNVSGEVFKKIKRGAVRILYSMNKDSKTMIFFVVQKKAWHYRF
ncbi:MAG: hypothetical protein Q8P80_02685 [Candidatus Levybacteria bacterium]|nr:hypothetical protein [Candidatus Levybacteria bacterium]